MARRTYIAVFDFSDPDIDIGKVQEFIRDGTDFAGWWNYLPATFLLQSDLDADAISAKLKPLVGEGKFLVMAVDPADSDGWLPKRGWEWIKKRARQAADADRGGK
ncbi:MAG TPA: hypothetical protein VMF62_01920 [Acetobacteraceae bacterium]|jgi:hypothetical protein|nr:hypothetical protein [Acetobacteraceae bacterium]